MAVGRADGLPPRRLVHTALGRPVDLAHRQPERRPGRAGAPTPGRRRHRPRRRAGHGVVRRRPARARSPPRPALRTHVPPALRGVMSVDWTWSFALEPVESGTRLRLRARATGSPTALVAWHLVVVPSDFVMARAMLRGIAERAERTATHAATEGSS